MLTSTKDRFQFSRDVRIALANPRSRDNQFAVDDFLADARDSAQLNLRRGGSGRRTILVGELDRPQIIQALKKTGVTIPSPLDGKVMY